MHAALCCPEHSCERSAAILGFAQGALPPAEPRGPQLHGIAADVPAFKSAAVKGATSFVRQHSLSPRCLSRGTWAAEPTPSPARL
eukprot:8751304-Pyramimonas_sp.AAC.1